MARGRTSSIRIVLSPDERATLEHWQRSTTVAAGLVRRGRIILLLADGYSHFQVARLVPAIRYNPGLFKALRGPAGTSRG